jgi:hypothetical protein
VDTLRSAEHTVAEYPNPEDCIIGKIPARCILTFLAYILSGKSTLMVLVQKHRL